MKNFSPTYNFIFYLKLFDDCDGPQQRKYIFDTGLPDNPKDRISLWVENQTLKLNVKDRGSIDYSVEISAATLFEDFKALFCQVITEENRTVLRLSINEETTSEHEVPGFPVIFTDPPIDQNYFIGSSVKGHDFGCFEMTEQLILDTIVQPDQTEKLLNYFNQKRKSGPLRAVQFKNGAYLYRNAGDRNLIQPYSAHQPKTVIINE